ncbi:hypothetical protein [Hyphomicrobium sp.]|uniref:hypothetical protein n=1 Tax=Hyphomicrobium sp. TaxID=82 RepID=UPI0035637BE0
MQSLQAAFACAILVVLIFSIPMVMASTPIHFDIAFMSPAHLIAGQQGAGGTASLVSP